MRWSNGIISYSLLTCETISGFWSNFVLNHSKAGWIQWCANFFRKIASFFWPWKIIIRSNFENEGLLMKFVDFSNASLQKKKHSNRLENVYFVLKWVTLYMKITLFCHVHKVLYIVYKFLGNLFRLLCKFTFVFIQGAVTASTWDTL